MRPTTIPSMVDLDFKLPDCKVLPPRPDQISTEAWLAWLEENHREMLKNGKLQKIRDNPLHCPVDARFKL